MKTVPVHCPAISGTTAFQKVLHMMVQSLIDHQTDVGFFTFIIPGPPGEEPEEITMVVPNDEVLQFIKECLERRRLAATAAAEAKAKQAAES